VLEPLDEPIPELSRREDPLGVPLPGESVPELPRLELPGESIPELLRLELPGVETPGVELLPEESVTPNALAVLLSSCPLVWIFCLRWNARNACCVRGPMTPSIGPGS